MKASCIAVWILLLPMATHAESVSLQLDNGITAVADYLPGNPAKPAALLLHGFLQTNQFHTIVGLAEELNAEGYTVLAPTLSLGVPHRGRSLACEAIHTHTLQNDLSEIARWMDWLQQRGHQSVYLVGHSSGSMVLLAYIDQALDARVAKLIGISLVEGRMELDAAQQADLREALRARIAAENQALVKYAFSFCKPLQATPASLLSYLEWTPERILQAVLAAKTPQIYIFGSLDERLGKDWISRLQQTGEPVVVIDGANHFMDGEHEFSLTDVVLEQLP